jgi:hypothetical protein
MDGNDGSGGYAMGQQQFREPYGPQPPGSRGHSRPGCSAGRAWDPLSGLISAQARKPCSDKAGQLRKATAFRPTTPRPTGGRTTALRGVGARAVAELLSELSREFGPGRIARPYRDVRFRADKSPHLGQGEPARGELTVQSTSSAIFSTNLTLTTIAGPVKFGSGWESADVTVHRHTFRFVNTHLEPFSNFYRTAQSKELLAGPLNTTGPVVLAGDLNSGPGDPVFTEPGSPFNNTNPYDQLTGAGLADAWVQANGSAAGPTCCNAADLLNPAPTLTRRIDHVLTKAGAGPATRDRVAGTDADNRHHTGQRPGIPAHLERSRQRAT